MADWSNIDEFNNYLSLSFGGDSYLSSATNPSVIQGKWSPAPNNLIFGVGGNATTDVGTGTYIYFNYRVFKVISVKSNNLIELDRTFYTSSASIYNINQTQYPTILVSDERKVRALYSAQIQITGSPEYIFPSTVADNMKYGLYEWAIWLLSGGKNSDYEARQAGLISKTVDVLEWQWDKNATVYSGSPSAQKYFEAYRNPNFTPGLGNSSTIFSF